VVGEQDESAAERVCGCGPSEALGQPLVERALPRSDKAADDSRVNRDGIVP